MLYLEILFVLLLILLNGLLAMSELAIVSSRRSRLEQMADQGDNGARTALNLIDDPSRFLSTVQIGITLVGVLAGAVSGATFADKLGDWLETFPAIAPNGDTIAIGLVVVVITYISLIVGELVPKRIALANPERVASRVARRMHLLSRVAAPAVWLLKISIDAVLRLINLSATRRETVTEDEVKSLIAEGTLAGIFAPQEREMIDGVLRLDDWPVRVIMTARSEIVWVDARADREALKRAVETCRFSRLLVCDDSIDQVVGVAHIKDMLPPALKNESIDLQSLMVPALTVPDHISALELINRFRLEGVHMAVVADERGVTEGVVTLTDLFETIAGQLPEGEGAVKPIIIQRDDGSWLVDGTLPIDELEDRVGLPGLREHGDFHTVAGFVLQQFDHVPARGESFLHGDVRFEVVRMDGPNVDKVLLRPAPDATAG